MKFTNRIWTLLTFVLLFAMLVMPIQAGSPPTDDADLAPRQDNKADPITTRQLDLKAKAIDAKLEGKALGKTHEVAKGQYVELEREGEGALWTVLGEFADLKHNSLPQPNRAVDNTTYLGAGLQPRPLHEPAVC